MRKRVPYREDRGCARKRLSESPASISTLHHWRQKLARPFFIPGQKTAEPKLNTVYKDDTKIYTGHKMHRLNKRNEQRHKTVPLLRRLFGQPQAFEVGHIKLRIDGPQKKNEQFDKNLSISIDRYPADML